MKVIKITDLGIDNFFDDYNNMLSMEYYAYHILFNNECACFLAKDINSGEWWADSQRKHGPFKNVENAIRYIIDNDMLSC